MQSVPGQPEKEARLWGHGKDLERKRHKCNWWTLGTDQSGGEMEDAGFLKVSNFCMLGKHPSTSNWLRVPWNGYWVSWHAFQASRHFKRADLLQLFSIRINHGWTRSKKKKKKR